MDEQPLPECTFLDGGTDAPRASAAPEPDRALVLEALVQAGDWRRQVVAHREQAVRAVHRPFRRTAWP
jgi:hypothetical protein